MNAAAPSSASAIDLEELVRDHIPLVGHAVRQVLTRVPAHVNRDDLSSAGMSALFLAARSYDPARGVAFARYASTRVRGALLDELRSVDWASRSVRRRARQVEEVRGTLTSSLGRAPSDAEVAGALGVGVTEISANQEDVSRAIVMSLQGFGDAGVDDVLPTGSLGPEALLEQRERLAYLRDAIEQLPDRNRTVVERYFLEERPMAEIATELGVTESRVSQIRAESLALLKVALNSALDPELVPAAERPNGCAARRREAYVAAVAAHRSFVSRLEPTGDE